MSTAHLAQRLCFDVRFATRELAEAQQQALASFAGRRAPDVIDEIFAAACDARTRWRLERLEVDLGPVFADELELEWERRLRERLALLLQEREHEQRALEDVGDARFGRCSTSAAALQDLCGFLQSGVLAWRSGPAADLPALVQASLQAHGPAFSRWLATHPLARARLALQYPAALALASEPCDVQALRDRFLSEVAAASFDGCAERVAALLQTDAVWLRTQLTRVCVHGATRRGLLGALDAATWRRVCELWLQPPHCQELLSLLSHPVLCGVAEPLQWREHLCCSLMLGEGPVPERERLLQRVFLHAAGARTESVAALIGGLIEQVQRRADALDAPLQGALRIMLEDVESEAGTLAVRRLRALRSRLSSGLTSVGALPSLSELEWLLRHDAPRLRAVLSDAGREPGVRRRCAAAWGLAGWRQCAQWLMPAGDAAALYALLSDPRVTAVAEPVELCEYAWRCAVLTYPAYSVARSQVAAALEAARGSSEESSAQLRRAAQAMLLERPATDHGLGHSTPAADPPREPPAHIARRACARLRLLEAIDTGRAAMAEGAWCALWRGLAADDSEWLQQVLLRHRSAAANLSADLAACYSDQALAELLAPWCTPAQRAAILKHVLQWAQRPGAAGWASRHDEAELLARLTTPSERGGAAAVASIDPEPDAAANWNDAERLRTAAPRAALDGAKTGADAGVASGVFALLDELSPAGVATTREWLWTRVLTRVWSGTTQDSLSSEPWPSSRSHRAQHVPAAAAEGIAAQTAEHWRSLQRALQGEVSARLACSERASLLPSSGGSGRAEPASQLISQLGLSRLSEPADEQSRRIPARHRHLSVQGSIEELEAAVTPLAAPQAASQGSMEHAEAALDAESRLRMREAALLTDEPGHLRQAFPALDRCIVEAVLHALIASAWQSDISQPHEQQRRLLRTALQARKVSEAVFAMLTAEQRTLMLQALQPLDHSMVQDVVRALHDAWSATVGPLDARRRAELEWQFIIQEYCVEERVFELDATSRRCVEWLCSREQPDSMHIVRELAHGLRSSSSRAIAKMASNAPLAPTVATKPSISGSARDLPEPALIGDALERDLRAATEELAQAVASVLEPSSDGAIAATLDAAPLIPVGETLYLDNAGMVLAAPYLPRLFEMLGLVSEDAFVSTAAAQRAVHVLQFLVNGAMTTPEFRLPLNKLLCGVPFVLPIALSVELSVEERATIEQLLQAMIQHWRILGSTSVAGLRETFLQREGRLTRRDDHLHLLVEPRPFDMLLDQLPWGYATIKYPWMEQVLHVQWR